MCLYQEVLKFVPGSFKCGAQSFEMWYTRACWAHPIRLGFKVHTVENHPFIKSQLASRKYRQGLVWCRYGHVTKSMRTKPSHATVWTIEGFKVTSNLIAHKEFSKTSCRSQLPHKSASSSFTVNKIKVDGFLRDLILQNDS